jgi:hypothetical protein
MMTAIVIYVALSSNGSIKSTHSSAAAATESVYPFNSIPCHHTQVIVENRPRNFKLRLRTVLAWMRSPRRKTLVLCHVAARKVEFELVEHLCVCVCVLKEQAAACPIITK